MSAAAPTLGRRALRLAPALALALAAAAALAATWPSAGVGLTGPAEALRATPGLISDGAATWLGWRPLATAWPDLAPYPAHALSSALWVALSLLTALAGRRLGLGWPGAALAAMALAAHPLAGPLAGDLASQGPLVALVGLAAALWAGLRSPHTPTSAAAAALFTALGGLGHPLAALAPVALFAAHPGPARARLTPPVLAATAAALLVLALDLALGGAPAPPRAPADLPTALAHAGRAFGVAVTGAPLLPWPWDLASPVRLSHPLVLAGATAILGALWAAVRLRRPGTRAGLGLAAAALAALAQPWAPPASPSPPVFAAVALLGLAWAAAAWLSARPIAYAAPALVAAASLVASAAPIRPVDRFASEAAAAQHALAAAPDAVALRLAVAERALDLDRPGVALAVTDGRPEPELAPLALEALLALRRWGDAGRVVARSAPDAAPALRCALASARADVDAERHCRDALARAPTALRPRLALAAALDRAGRSAEAEALLRAAVADGGSARAWAALVDHFERFGWVREAAAEAEAWLVQRPADRGARLRLLALLERKVRGDLLERRFPDAASAARRLLALAPERAEVRHYLADALAGAGDADAAALERARAEAAGAARPAAPDGLPRDAGHAAPPPALPPPPGLPRERP